MANEEGEQIPTTEEEFKRQFSEDQAGTVWRVLQLVLQINQATEEKIRGLVAEMFPEKYQELEKKEREQALINLLAQELEGGEGS